MTAVSLLPYTPKLIVDAHLDLAYNVLGWGRNYRRSAHWNRRREVGLAVERENGQCCVGLPDLIRGRVGIVFGTIFAEPSQRRSAHSPLTYRDEREAHALGMAQLDFYRRWADEEPHIRLIGSRRDLSEVIGGWGLVLTPSGELQPRLEARAPAIHPLGIVPLMEGADPILEPKELERWVERGLRIVGPAWHRTRYSAGSDEPGGLTKLGRALLDVIAELDVILDVSHMAHRALFEALDTFEGRFVIASHSNPHRIVPEERHVPDRAIEAIAERGGVIGIVLFNKFLKRGWDAGSKKHEVTLDDVVRAIDHVCQVTGSADHVGIGSDFDGGLGAQHIPWELDSSRDLWKIGAMLLQHGFSTQDVDKIMGGNWLRVLHAALQ
ncbi:MAG: membrane dipeptidase [Anaerolineae bacterium]|nr:membrane dipeptidase [Thermoflexales bacterium]MDW8407602.1 membrane dipeptidase [Anaerolineae bacterium]